MINFNTTGIRDYRLVQRQLMRSITTHLPEGAWTRSRRTYVEGSLNVSLFINIESDVLMSHGAADKNYHWRRVEGGEYTSNAFRRTDILVPGPFLARRIADDPRLHVGPGHVHSVGWPRLDVLLVRQRALDAAQKPARPWRRGRRTRILWAPTHDRVRRTPPITSHPTFLPYLETLREHFDVEVSLHPRNREDKTPTRDLLIESDVVIADFGTTLYEAWALGKQVIFPSWIIGDGMAQHALGSAENRIFAERIGLHPRSIEELVEMVATKAENGAAFDAHLRDCLDPAFLGTSGRRIADLLTELDEARGESS